VGRPPPPTGDLIVAWSSIRSPSPGPGAGPAPAARAASLRDLADERFDVLVIGGGIVGAGAFLDAASRGLKAALVEQADIASGTSGRSSRLIHGGLRYLEQLHFGLVAEALEERSRLLRLAPHLVRLEPFLFPIYGLPLLHEAFYGAGILLYDLLGARRDGGFARHLRPSGVLEYVPELRREGLTAGIVYHDGVEDDARLALAVVRTALAANAGAVAATRVRAEAPILGAGRIDGARVRDLTTDAILDVRADRVIDAIGVWASRPEASFAPEPGSGRVVPSRGSHIVIRRERLAAAGGLTIRIPGRVVFVIPWPDHWIIGTTDHLDERPLEGLSAPNEDVDELLATLNRTTRLELARDDIVGTYAGMRPLIGGSGDSTVKTSREHKVTTDPSGLVRIGGGKYTTYRVMARDVVDAALGPAEARRRPSRTAELPLVGAAPRDDLDRLARGLATITSGPVRGRGRLDEASAERLVARHGSEARAVLELGREVGLVDPDGMPLPLGVGSHLAAEVPWAVRHELALTLDDVLARRMRLSQVLPDRGASIAPRVAELMAAELGWDVDRRAAEVEAYLETARREYGVPWPPT
jgi:glycerol-3-phosphate dehydrogenase